MGTSRTLIYIAAIFALTGTLWVAVPPAHAIDVITVDTTEDPIKPVHNENCSLREAIEAANTNTVVDECDGTITDIIAFNIPGAGEKTITLSDYLLVTTQVTIDGTTQSGYSSVSGPLIHITAASAGLIIFQDTAEGSIIRGLKFSQGNAGWGFALALDGDKYQVKACYFGTDGTASLDNYSQGIGVYGSNSTIGGSAAADRNVFGGARGIYVRAGNGNTIQGNYFGVRASDGSAALIGDYGSSDANSDAIRIAPDSTSNGNTIRGNIIGGFYNGIELTHQTTSNTIVGNYIGVGANGSTAIGNRVGILLYGSSNNTIGGTTAADRNIISANTFYNIDLITGLGPSTPTGNTIQGNYIGTSANGLTGLSSTVSGIHFGAGSNTTIGGTAAGAGNVISGNSIGIEVGTGTTGTIIRGNKMGTDPSGTIAVGNTYGVHADTAVNIGDSLTPGNNIIGGDPSGVGILLDGSSGSTVYGNRIGVGAAAKSLPTATGVGLWNASATLGGNWIAFNAEGIYLAGTSTVSAAATMNCFNGSSGYAVRNDNTGHEAPFTNNWWGSDTGPRHLSNSGGTGDVVSDHVTYAPYLTLPAAACHIFADVPVAGKEWMEPWVDSFYMHGITTGCGANPLTYCPENPVTRAAMAVFILRAIEGPTYTPPAAHGYFDDLPVAGKEWMEPWVDEFYDRGITTGCGTSPLRYCPENPVTRAAMAVFLLRAMEGAAYAPGHTHHYFSDLPVAGKEWMEPYVDEFYDRGITTGCGAAPLTYCPENPVTRAAMAVFIGRAYNLYP